MVTLDIAESGKERVQPRSGVFANPLQDNKDLLAVTSVAGNCDRDHTEIRAMNVRLAEKAGAGWRFRSSLAST